MLRILTMLAVLGTGCSSVAFAERSSTTFSPVRPGINQAPMQHGRIASALGFGVGAAMACGVDKTDAARVAQLGATALRAVSASDRDRLVVSLASGMRAIRSGEAHCRTMLPMFRQMRRAFGS